MENTIENKAKFFAQYLGQQIEYTTDDEQNPLDMPYPVSGLNYKQMDFQSYLLLTPISSVTDEDAIEVAKIVYKNPDAQTLERGIGYIDKMTSTDSYHGGYYKYFTVLSVCDFLRSKGYLLPFMDLSDEDILNYKWAVIKP